MDITSITKLYTIFSDKKWTDKEGNKIVFSNFCKLLLNLNESQRELIIDLAERYTWITLSEYQSKLINILESVENEKMEGIKKIILFPVMKPEDEKKTKSGHTILYMLKAIKPLLTRYKEIDFIEIESYETIKSSNFKLKDTDAVFLLDDYLGSGETIEATLKEVLSNRNIEPKQLNVISIASQFDSTEFLKNIGVAYYTDLITKKGISDYYKSPELEEKIEIMTEIEKLIPGNHFSFGYNQSEALITLMRTPDNTFPIFWKEHKKSGEFYDAPFSRY
jgi:hypoxanthine-guanine phosphoribosyltransferase